MHKLLEWIESAAVEVVLLAYLAAGIVAVAVWFGAGELPPFWTHLLTTFQPWALAVAVEAQTYFTVRGLTKRWHELRAPALEKPVRDQMHHEVLMYGVCLIVLVGFSVWNQLNYNLLHWVPTANPVIPIPPMVEYAVKSLVIPLLFFGVAFIAPAPETLAGKMERESRKTLGQFLKVLNAQRKRMLKSIQKQDIDMGPSIQQVATVAGEKRAGATIAAIQSAVVNLTGDKAVHEVVQQVNQQAAPEGSAESRARKAWRQGMTVKQLMTAAGISKTSAQRWRRRFVNETSQTVRLVKRA